MRAFHTISSAPFFARRGENAVFEMSAEDLYCAVISALKWRGLNGEISLYCDAAAYDFAEKTDLLKVWNRIYPTVPQDLEGINPLMFWAAGKLFALRESDAPAVMLDTDFIVWKKLELPKKSVTCTHREDLTDGIYPPLESFSMTGGYSVREEFLENQWNVLPCNTSFAYFPDVGFKNSYLAHAFDFMKHSDPSGDFLTYMVAAEQRMLALCADLYGIHINALMDKDGLFLPQNSFTHLWGAKAEMRGNTVERKKFYAACKRRIRNDFPEFEYVINSIEKFEN